MNHEQQGDGCGQRVSMKYKFYKIFILKKMDQKSISAIKSKFYKNYGDG
jgi:hypothetical protein